MADTPVIINTLPAEQVIITDWQHLQQLAAKDVIIANLRAELAGKDVVIADKQEQLITKTTEFVQMQALYNGLVRANIELQQQLEQRPPLAPPQDSSTNSSPLSEPDSTQEREGRVSRMASPPASTLSTSYNVLDLSRAISEMDKDGSFFF